MGRTHRSTTTDLPRGTVTFLFTDIEGSTRRWEVHGEAMGSCIARHDAILRAAVEDAGGRWVKSTGDGIMAVFIDGGDALDAAMAGQAGIAAEDWAPVPPLRVRMGIHTGWCEPAGADYFGAVVGRAARIADAGHGGHVLLSGTSAAVLDPVRRRQLIFRGAARLKDLAEPIELYQALVPGFDDDPVPLRTLDPEVDDLPIQRTTFIGRDEDLERTVRAIEHHRLVTLVGVGGVGKTRLAVQAGAELTQQFEAGVRLVDLATTSDSKGVATSILNALVRRSATPLIGPPGDDPIVGIIKTLGPSEVLLIVDNCEHVLDGASRVVDAVLDGCHQVKVLTTSREALRLPGEQVIPVTPLAVPDHDERSLENAALQLFVERAITAGAPAPDADGLDAAARICRLVDGLPLGIELAAARSLHLSLGELADRLEDQHDILVGRDRRRPDRHQTLDRLLQWSYGLLEPAERALLVRLGMFTGPLGLDAIEATCSDEALPGADIIEHLGSLVDRSLVVHEGQVGRYTLLNIVRSFARAQMTDDERDRWAERHANWCADSLAAASGEETDDALSNYMRAYGTEVATALEWASATGRAELAWRLAGSSWRWYEMTGRLREGHELVQRALATAPPEQGTAWASAAEGAASLTMVLGDLRGAAEMHRRAIDAFRAADDRSGEAWARTGLSIALMLAGDPDALDEANAALAIFDHIGNRRGAGHAQASLGIISARTGEPDRAERHYLEALSILRVEGQRRDAASVLSNLGNLAQDRQDLMKATRYYDGAIQIYQDLGDHRGAGLILNNLCLVAQARGHTDRAIELAKEAIGEFGRINDRQGTAAARHNLANLAAEVGDRVEALAQYHAAIEGFREALDPRGVVMVLDTAIDLARRCGADGLAWRYEVHQALILSRLGLREGTRRSLRKLRSHALLLGFAELAQEFERAIDSMSSVDIAAALDQARLVRPEDHAVDLGGVEIDLPDHPGLEELTERERELLRELGEGKTNSEIAETLFISRRTVDAHLSHIRTKLGISDRSKLLVFARERLGDVTGARR